MKTKPSLRKSPMKALTGDSRRAYSPLRTHTALNLARLRWQRNTVQGGAARPGRGLAGMGLC